MWNLENKYVTGIYLGLFPVGGMVDHSRVKYGGEVSHHVQLREPIKVFGVVRDRVILEPKDIHYIYDEPPVEIKR